MAVVVMGEKPPIPQKKGDIVVTMVRHPSEKSKSQLG